MLVGEVFARMGLDSKQYEKDLSRLEGVTRREATTLGSIFKNAFSVALGMGVFEAVKRGFQTIASTAISFNAQMEQARIGFTTMLGSAERADKFLRDVADFAARTPFEFPELLDAAKRMLAYGFAAEDVLPTMEAVGNASAAVGLGTAGINRIILALGQMRAKGKVTGEEMRQLTETGIPAWEMLAEAMGFSADEVGKVMDMASKGLIPADRAIKMLVEGMNKRFPDMMKKMENTWEGVTSTIKDIWQMTIGKLTENLFEGLKTWLQGVRDWAVDFYDTLQKYGPKAALSKIFGREIASAIITIGNAVKLAMRLAWGFAKYIIKYWGIISKVTLFLVKSFLLFKVITKVITLAKTATWAFALTVSVLRGQSIITGGALGILSKALEYYRYQLHLASLAGVTSVGVMTRMVIGIKSIGYAIKGLLASIPVIGWIVLAIGLLAEAAIYAYNNWEKVKHYTLQVWSGIKQGIAYYVYGILSLYRLLFGWIPGVGAALDVMRKKALEIARAETAIRKARAEAFAQKPLDPYAEYEKKMEEYYKQLEEYEASLDSSLAGAKDGVEETTEGIKDMNKAAKGGLLAFDEIHQLTKETGRLAGDGLGLDEIGLGEMPVMAGMPEMPKMPEIDTTGFVEKISGMWGDIKAAASAAWSDMWDNIFDTMAEAREAFLSDPFWVAVGRIWDKVKIGWGNFLTWAGGMWDGVKIKWGDFKTWAGNLWDSVKIKWDNFKTNIQQKWNVFWEPVKTQWNSFKSWAGELLAPVKQKWNSFVTWAHGIWDGLLKKWNEIKSWSLWKWIGDQAHWLKNIFNFKWSLPKIKLPRFTVSWSTAGFWGSIGKFLGLPGKPIIDVTWLAKGGILTRPTLFGGGEAGREAVLPLDNNTGWADIVADRLAAALQKTQLAGAGAGGGDIYVYIGNEQVDAYIYRAQERRNVRSNGR